jgi:CRISPR system Cascade subunit CasD
MPEILILRFDAPLMSFGGVTVDEQGVTRLFPGRAMLTGLLANALGYDHSEWAPLQALQARLRYAARCDRAGEIIVDYQTVDLGQTFMRVGWTNRGHIEERGGGTAATGTHIRYRRFLADAIYTLSLTLADSTQTPILKDLEAALREPSRPLFIGRKPCLPSAPLLAGRMQAATLLQALEGYPAVATSRESLGRPLNAWWPGDEDTGRPEARLIPVTDDRDWRNQIHVGRRWIYEGTIHVHTAAVDG